MSLTEPSAGRVCLVDDNAEFRRSAAWWLESLGYEVTAFQDPAECLEAVDQDAGLREEACLLLDVRMPQMDGLQLMDALRKKGVTRPVIFMTGHGDVPLAVAAMRRGALTFLEKPFQETALEEALTAAFTTSDTGSEDLLDPQIIEYEERVARLTPRESEVMALVVQGHPNKVIAYKLDISPKTVELHRSRIMTKMQAATLTHLVRMAVGGRVLER